jgi:low affinity Fe/Cu permease
MAGKGAQKPGVFSRFTTRTAKALGHAWVSIAALLILVLWGISGPLMGFSDTWQLIINTGTTIVTFLMVFINRTRRTGIRPPYTSNSMP